MRSLLVIRPASLVDAITNSSSEAFVVEGGRTLEEVRGITHEIFEAAWSRYEALRDSGELGEYDYWQFRNVSGPHGLYEVFEAEDALDWFGGRNVWEAGDIVVESSDSNSIPPELFDELESALNATRYHLG